MGTKKNTRRNAHLYQVAIPKEEYAGYAADAERRGLTFNAWILNRLREAQRFVPLLEEIHEATVTRGIAGLGEEGRDAMAALRQLGLSVPAARSLIRDVLTDQPTATANEIALEAMKRHGGAK